MKVIDENMSTRSYIGTGLFNYEDSLTLTTKGLDLAFARVLTTNIIIDLSNNRFEGYIPSIIGDLIGLRTLNLYRNGLEVLNLSHNHLVGCIPKGKQFDTFDSSSYKGNDILHGFPLSKDCGGDDGVPQATTPVELDQGGEGDSAMISWQAFLMGYGCGLTVVLFVIYIMLATQNPAWFSRMVEELEQRIITRMKKKKKLACNLQDSSLLSCWDANKSFYFPSL
ncbi:hypothetical protein K7X08_026280 [Anisodus acutangulus]|uniref:Uncharacterized protein n=1 Tax=Anisodus acutangulus TaxID=402998 RepID=A0A9Q1RS88_9SOLA|nr:hypothetical protein K7X08_026280 [Anisodus acutangulus]